MSDCRALRRPRWSTSVVNYCQRCILFTFGRSQRQAMAIRLDRWTDDAEYSFLTDPRTISGWAAGDAIPFNCRVSKPEAERSMAQTGTPAPASVARQSNLSTCVLCKGARLISRDWRSNQGSAAAERREAGAGMLLVFPRAECISNDPQRSLKSSSMTVKRFRDTGGR
jgi:hypothetical protein